MSGETSGGADASDGAVSIDDIKVQSDKNHSRDIVLDENLTMRMKYPSLDEFIKSNFSFDGKFGVDESFQLIASSVEQIYNEEESWNFNKKSYSLN